MNYRILNYQRKFTWNKNSGVKNTTSYYQRPTPYVSKQTVKILKVKTGIGKRLENRYSKTTKGLYCKRAVWSNKTATCIELTAGAEKPHFSCQLLMKWTQAVPVQDVSPDRAGCLAPSSVPDKQSRCKAAPRWHPLPSYPTPAGC